MLKKNYSKKPRSILLVTEVLRIYTISNEEQKIRFFFYYYNRMKFGCNNHRLTSYKHVMYKIILHCLKINKYLS